MRKSTLLMTSGIAALAVLGACGTRQVTRPVSEHSSECRVVFQRSDAVGRLAFGLPEPVDLTRAPWAGNTSERILFGHLYETLITIDCEGRVQPGLAESWTSEEGGSRWTFELRRDARFWDDSRVTAEDVVASWRDALTLHTVIDSVSAAGERKLRAWLKAPHREVPRVFSATVFAVTKTAGDSGWLMGSGPYRLHASEVRATPSSVRSITVHPAHGGEGPSIDFLEVPVERARDFLERTTNVTVTSDPAVIEYASGQSRFITLPLPWDKTYALLSTSRAAQLREGRPAAEISPDLLDGLARDAVRGDARAFQPPSWWDDPRDCGAPALAAQSARLDRSAVSQPVIAGDNRRILYDANDPVARGLAERIAALAVVDTTRSPEARAFARTIPGFSGTGRGTMAEGVPLREFETRLRSGDAFAYVVCLPRETPDPCYESDELGARVPWLRGEGLRLADVLVPLVDTRSHVIAAKDTADLLIDGYGNVLVMPGPMKKDGSR